MIIYLKESIIGTKKNTIQFTCTHKINRNVCCRDRESVFPKMTMVVFWMAAVSFLTLFSEDHGFRDK